MIENSIIFWDFDGVLIDSHATRDLGFQKVLAGFPKEQVAKLINFHKANGGLSRYVKFRYFFEEIRNESISENQVVVWAERFSSIMKKTLLNKNLLINETLDFVKKNHKKHKMHIVSGSDGNELNYLCKELGIDIYFLSIHGSPTPKKELIKQLIQGQNYLIKDCVMIGDSINDWDAAFENEIDFLAYNNNDLNIKNTIQSFL
jgi:phosphoglycolate phosphatase-like HAD superfamily hydrolase